MFGKKVDKKQFGYRPVHTEITKKDLPLKERMKITSFSSQEGRNTKKRTIILTIFLIAIVAVMISFGVSVTSVHDLKIKDTEFEKITP
ncbi:MAG: hypothetical protein PF574_04265 [Candidatus Delongbacteria bacterium]|jgi:beta-lactamase regulating signal transducer with metallopeptidase domain|nr:hypothetical protein [Candidatus Delongbacteria bacterium]